MIGRGRRGCVAQVMDGVLDYKDISIHCHHGGFKGVRRGSNCYVSEQLGELAKCLRQRLH